MNSEFNNTIDRIKTKYMITQWELAERLGIAETTLIRYYLGIRNVNPDVMENLIKLEEKLKDNEFRKLANLLGNEFFLTAREISKRLEMTEVLYWRYYHGGKKTPAEVIAKMENIYNEEKALKLENKSKEETSKKMSLIREKGIKYAEAMHKLSKLNDEHRAEVYGIIDLYTAFEKDQEETNNVTKKLTIE